MAKKKPNKEASKHELLTFGSGVLLTPPVPRNLHFISDSRACHEINLLR